MKSPFKFLDAYGLDDRDVFFGREEEVSRLYSMITQNRLVLVYGQSGTGKTSLIQCGLANRFDIADWFPVLIRRQNDMNLSLKQRLQAASGEESHGTAVQMLVDVYMNYLRPIYLIFDQLEEIFILGSAQEQEEFIQTIHAFLGTRIPCRILFVIREEYLAHLYPFERVIPTLYDRRLRVEPMSRSRVKDVLKGSFKSFQINVREPVDDSYNLIIDNVSDKKTGIELPYLQVYLDILYREDFERTYPGRETKPGEWLPLEFTLEEIASFGPMENVLERFLQEQREGLQKYLKSKFRDADRETVDKVLDTFVSEEGTKRPIHFSWAGNTPIADPNLAHLFAPLPPEIFGACCLLLQQARLLHFEDDQMELAHDTLATLIDQRRSAEQRHLFEIRRRILTAYKEHLDDNSHFLDAGQLARIEPFLPKIEVTLDPEWKEFLNKSRSEVDRREKAERDRELRIAEEKLEAEKKEKRRRTFFLWIIAVVAAMAIIALILAFIQQGLTNSARLQAEKNAADAKSAKMEAEKNAANAQTAENTAKANLILAQENEKKAQAALDSAEQNLRKAIAAIAVADSISKQLQQEKTATEEQKRIAEENARQADKNAKEAKDALAQAIAATKEAEKQTAKVVDNLLKEAANDIYYLRYGDAVQKLKSAGALGQHKPEVVRTLMEVTYFYSEAGKFSKAQELLGQIANLDANYTPPMNLDTTNSNATRKTIEDALRSVDPNKVRELKIRYYPDMVEVHDGIYAYGCEKGRDCSKYPQVRLSKFSIARTETTIWQYALYCESKGIDILETQVKSWSELRGDDPVVNVSWLDAIQYANWLTEQSGLNPIYRIDTPIRKQPVSGNVSFQSSAKGFRLPTDAEWEFAARGGNANGGDWYAGSDSPDQVAWYSDKPANRTNAVAKLQPNSLGLCDMSGNVWEWCWDWYIKGYDPGNRENPTGPPPGTDRVLRGGSWSNKADYVKIIYRGSNNPLRKAPNIGFRVVKKE